MLRQLNELILKILFSEEGDLLARCRIEREKFYLGPGLEPRPLVLRTKVMTMELSGKVRIHDRTNLLEPSFLTSGPTDCVVIMSYGGMGTQTLE